MTTTLSSENNELVSLFAYLSENNVTPRFAARVDDTQEAMSPSSTELSDDSSLTNDDLVVLSDLFGFVNPSSTTSTTSTTSAKRSTPSSRPRSRKRPRATKAVSEDGSVLPKSQQQRQKLEIECLKKQVVELTATIEDLQTRKFERERQELEKSQRFNVKDDESSTLNEWVGAAKYQVAAVQQLEDQNEKLRSQVAAHLGQLKQLEHIARTRYLANAIPEPRQLTGPHHPTATYYSAY